MRYLDYIKFKDLLLELVVIYGPMPGSGLC